MNFIYEHIVADFDYLVICVFVPFIWFYAVFVKFGY